VPPAKWWKQVAAFLGVSHRVFSCMPEFSTCSAISTSSSFSAITWRIFLGWPRYLLLIVVAAFAGDVLHFVADPR
jgi:hypothetical protein